jgi:hypothetical protein
VKAVAFLILMPLLGNCAALAPDALSAFRKPGVPLGLQDVVTLSDADVSKGAIVDYLYSFGRHFNLSPADIAQLHRDGVSPDLIDYMSSPSAHPSPFGF